MVSQASYSNFKIKSYFLKSSYEFIEELKDIKIDDLPSKHIAFSKDDCSKMILSKDGKSIIYEDVIYISRVYLKSNKYDNLKMKVNGLEIKGSSLKFELKNNCSEVVPYRFDSNANQMFRGLRLKINDRVSGSGYGDGGIFNKDGYIDNKFTGKITDKQKLRNLKNNDFSDYRYHISSGSNCIEVITKRWREKRRHNTSRFIVLGEIFNESDKVYSQNSNIYPSLYFGNMICQSSSKPVIKKLICDNTDELTSLPLTNLTPSSASYSKAKDDHDVRVSGAQTCEKNIRKYEKENNLKIPISPYLTKEEITMLKAGLDPLFENWKKIQKKSK